MWEQLTQSALLRACIRSYFTSQDFLEVVTPVVVACPGVEPYLGYFSSQWRDLRGQLHPVGLRSSPEMHMKQLLGQARQNIYQIGPAFRNDGELSPQHLPEFMMLEWYQRGCCVDDLVDTTLQLLAKIFAEWRRQVGPPAVELDQDQIVRCTVQEAFWEFAGIEFVDEDPGLAARALERGVVSVGRDDDFETAYFKTWIEVIEPRLADFSVAVISGFPPSQAILSKVIEGQAQRVELYLHGTELGNGFAELLDPQANAARLDAAAAKRLAAGKPPVGEDPDFLPSLSGIRDSWLGLALGVDRLHGLLTGQPLADCVPLARRAPFAVQL